MTGGAPIFESSQLANGLRVICCKEFFIKSGRSIRLMRAQILEHALHSCSLIIGNKRVANLRCIDRSAYSCSTGRNEGACRAASSLDFIKPPAADCRVFIREMSLFVPLVPEPV